MAALSVEDHEILGRIWTLWEKVGEAEVQSDLEIAADSAIQHLDREWRSDRWTEFCLVVGGSCSVALWLRHRDAAAAYRRLQPVADKILSLGWMQGGPWGDLEVNEVQKFFGSLSQCEAVITPRPRRKQGAVE